MRLVVPYVGEILPADARLIRLAEFLGIACKAVSAEPQAGGGFWNPNSELAGGACCLVVNPDVIRQCLHDAVSLPEFVAALSSQFHRMLVHSVRSDPFHVALVSAVTGGCFYDVRKAQTCGPLVMSPDSRDICEAFAGLSISAANLANDWVFSGGEAVGCRTLIKLGPDAFFAAFTTGDTAVLLLGSRDVIDLNEEVGEAWLSESFSMFVPYAMALRHLFGEECWRPVQSHAGVLVDDPLLRPNYGFLNFERLLQLMQEHNFKTTIAFIPHNFRRSSKQIIRLFKENADRFSICFHGNDHMSAEFAAADPELLNAMLEIAQRRMTTFSRRTGLPYDRIMVFPQGRFSVDAMTALGSYNFDAAVNTVPQPYRQPLRLTLRELAEPALHRYSGFPLFLRKCSQDTQDADIAFKLFFGIPILIVEHHEIFANPQALIDAVDRINRAAPKVHWSGAGDAVSGSFLRRQISPGSVQLRAFARCIRVENPDSAAKQFQIEWSYPASKSSLDGVYRNDLRRVEHRADETWIYISALIDAGSSEVFSIRHRETDAPLARTGFRYATRAFVRRRLSEVRDNYLSKSPTLQAAAKALQRRMQH